MGSDARHSCGQSCCPLEEATSHATGAPVGDQMQKGSRVAVGKACHEKTSSRLEKELSALEAERRRIEGFMDMLPHCRKLLDEAIKFTRGKIEEKRLLRAHSTTCPSENHRDSVRRSLIEPEESVVPTIGGGAWEDSSITGDAVISVNPVHAPPLAGEVDCAKQLKKTAAEKLLDDKAQCESERCKAPFRLSTCMDKPLGMLTLACNAQVMDHHEECGNSSANQEHERRCLRQLEEKASAEEEEGEEEEEVSPSWLWGRLSAEQSFNERNADKEDNENTHVNGYHEEVRRSWLGRLPAEEDDLSSGRCQLHQPHIPLMPIKGGKETHMMEDAGNDNSFLPPGRERPCGAFLPFVPSRDKASAGVATSNGVPAIQGGLPPACMDLVLGLAQGNIPEPQHRGTQTETSNCEGHREHGQVEMMEVDRAQKCPTVEPAPKVGELEVEMTADGSTQEKEEDMTSCDLSREGSRGRSINGKGGDPEATEGGEYGGSELSENSGGRDSEVTNTTLLASGDAVCNGHGNIIAATFNVSSGAGHRKARRCWSPELHRRFVDALTILGGPQVATPKQIRELMKVEGLTNDEVKSHLQKYRLHTRRPSPMPPQNIPIAHPPQVFVLGSFYLPDYGATPAVSQQPSIVAMTASQGVYDSAAAAAGGSVAGGYSTPVGPVTAVAPVTSVTPVAPIAAGGLGQKHTHFGLHVPSLQTQTMVSTQSSQVLHQHQFFPCKPTHGMTPVGTGQVIACPSSQQENRLQHSPCQPDINMDADADTTPLSMAVALSVPHQLPGQDVMMEQRGQRSREHRIVELTDGEGGGKVSKDGSGRNLGAGVQTTVVDTVELQTLENLSRGGRKVGLKRCLDADNGHGWQEDEKSYRCLKLQLGDERMIGDGGYDDDCRACTPRGSRAVAVPSYGNHRGLYFPHPVLSQSV